MDRLTSEHRNFLMEQVRTAKLATVRKDGRPHVTRDFSVTKHSFAVMFLRHKGGMLLVKNGMEKK